MFEKIVERILKKYLAPYIDGISKDGLSILKGDLALQKLKIKAEALDWLQRSGVQLRKGQIGRLRVHIPWRQLTQGKITIELEAITVDVARCDSEIPDDTTVLQDNWNAKVAKIEKKAQDLAELADNTDGQESVGYMGRWMHRLAQNIQITLGGGIMLQGTDPVQKLCGGLLLKSIVVHSVGDAAADPSVVALQKQIEITDIAAYVSVAEAPPRYILEPTGLRLCIDHRANCLAVKLEVLERQASPEHPVNRGCRLAISRIALYHLAVTAQELAAWQSYTQDVISRHCAHIRTDNTSLQGETYLQYTQLYRRRLMGGSETLSREEEEQLQAIEEAVMSRHLARWRLEVHSALKTKKAQTTGRLGRLRAWKGHSEVVQEGEWEEIQTLVREEQAHLADLDRPRTMAINLGVARISLQLYDDLSSMQRERLDTFESCIGSFQESGEGTHVSVAEDKCYADLCDNLDAFALDTIISHDLRIEFEQPQTSARVTPRTVADHERTEWSFGLCFGKMEVWCDREVALHYMSSDSHMALGRDDPHLFKDISVYSRIQDDGTEQITAKVCLPPTKLCTSPNMLAVVLSLVKFKLPPPPSYRAQESAPCATASLTAMDGYEEDSLLMHGSYWDEWQDDFSQWKMAQREIVLETAEMHAERAKKSSLVFEVDVSIAAPQLTVIVSSGSRLHVDLGRIHLFTDGVIKADNFTVSLELSDTQVTCISDEGSGAKELSLPLLEPISLSVHLHGRKPEHAAGAAKASSQRRQTESVQDASFPLKLQLDIALRQLRLAVSPQAVHLIARLPAAYLSVLSLEDDEMGSQVYRRLSRHSSLHPERRNSGASLLEAIGTSGTRLSTTKEPDSSEAEAAAGTVGSSRRDCPLILHTSAALELISLSLFDTQGLEVARADIVELSAEGHLLPAAGISGSASLEYFLVDVLGQPLVQMRDSKPGKPIPKEQADRQALHVYFQQPAEPPMTLQVRVCPVVVDWRKSNIKALVATAISCAPPAPGRQSTRQPDDLAEETIKDLSLMLTKRRRTRRDSLRGRQPGPPQPLQPRQNEPACDPDGSREVARQGLIAHGQLPPLQADLKQAGCALATLSMAVEVKFGGLAIKLHLGEEEQQGLCPAWKGMSNSPLIESHAVGLCVSFHSYDNGEARCRTVLDSFALLYDGQCILAPWLSNLSVFESELRLYLPLESGGPVHSACFKGMVRKISYVFFEKHLESLLQYVSSSVVGAVVQGAAEEAIESTQGNVALWNICMESPVLHFSRDEEMLQYSPAWKDIPVSLRSRCTGPKRASYAERAAEAHGELDADAFADASEHPTPVVESLGQYFVLLPGSLEARNTFDAAGADGSPPFVCVVSLSDTTLDAKDRFGPGSGCMLKVSNWEVVVRVDAESKPEPQHISIGLRFHPICCFLTQSNVELLLNFLQENIRYWVYFPQASAEAPAGALPSAGPPALPAFAERALKGSGTNDGSGDREVKSEGEECHIQSMSINVRLEFAGLNMTLSKLGPSAMHEPLLSLNVGDMRLLVDTVFFHGPKPLVLQLGLFLNSISADDMRAPHLRAGALPTQLLRIDTEGGFSSPGGFDDWVFVPTRLEGKVPYVPGNAALLLIYTIASETDSECRFELRRPQVCSLLRLASDAGDVLSGAFSQSSLARYPGPPLPAGEELPPAPRTPAEASFRICLQVEEAVLRIYTSCERVDLPVIEVVGSLGTEIILGSTSTQIKYVNMYDLNVRRTEMHDSAVPGTADSQACSSAVHLVQQFSLRAVGEHLPLTRPRVELHVHVLPVRVRLTALDVPHLLAAVSALGTDGQDAAPAAVPLQDDSCLGEAPVQPEMASSSAPRGCGGSAAVSACAGNLRFCAVGLVGIPNPEGLSLSAQFGDHGQWIALAWGEPCLLAVPAQVHHTGVRRHVGGGPLLRLALHSPGAPSVECLASLAFPVELCAGAGLQGSRVMRLTTQAPSTGAPCTPSPEVTGKLGAAAPELVFEAHYESCSSDDAVAMGVAQFSASAGSLQDFVKPVQQLEQFLGEPLPQVQLSSSSRSKKQKTGYSLRSPLLEEPIAASADLEPEAGTAPISVGLRVTFEGLEASFLDDCQANVLPVLQFSVRACSNASREAAEGLRHGPRCSRIMRSQALQMGALANSGILLQVNPWKEGSDQQQLGASLRVEDCTIGVSYLNVRAGRWEPFLEPWSFDVFYSTFEDPRTIGDVPTEVLNAKYPAATELTLVSCVPLNVNVTPQLCSLATWLLSNQEAYMERFSGEASTGRAVDSAGGSRYRLLNMSGFPLHLALFPLGSLRAPLAGQAGAVGAPAARGTPDSADRGRPGGEGLNWHVFEPCCSEVPLDSLLGHRSAEEWRLMADETIACQVQLLPSPTGSSQGSPRCNAGVMEMSLREGGQDVTQVLLSSTCNSALPVSSAHQGPAAYAACEVLAPHPSHHVLLISSRLRVFNHTEKSLEVRFGTQGSHDSGGVCAPAVAEPLPLFVPLHVLPERLAFPPKIAATLHTGMGKAASDTVKPLKPRLSSSLSSCLQADPDASCAGRTCKSVQSESPDQVPVDTEVGGHVVNAPTLPPEHFCSAPVRAAATASVVQLRLPGMEAWSNPIPLRAEAGAEEEQGYAVLVPSGDEAPLRFFAYLSCSHLTCPVGVDGAVMAVHICAPLQLVNATPVRLSFHFQICSAMEAWSQVPLTPEAKTCKTYIPKPPSAVSTAAEVEEVELVPMQQQGSPAAAAAACHVVEVDAFSGCDVPPQLDPAKPFGLCLAIADDGVDVSLPGVFALAGRTATSCPWASSAMVPRVFDPSEQPEEFVPVPLFRDSADNGPAFGVTVSRGLACRAACGHWFVDRTGLGLRVLCHCGPEGPAADAAPLPQVDGHITLLDHVPPQAHTGRWRRSLQDLKYYLAVRNSEGGGWSALAPAKLPESNGGFTHATLTRAFPATSSTELTGYPVHVCLQAEAVSTKLTFGMPCQVISALPQVIVYNQLTDDALTVRATGDPHTALTLQASQSGSFLRWRAEASASSGKSSLTMQFRPVGLAETADWSVPISFAVGEATGPMAMMLSVNNSQPRCTPCVRRMFTAEVAERGGIMCLTVSRGSRCELQNFSRLVMNVSIRPLARGWQRHEPGRVELEEFAARSCETTEFAWPLVGWEPHVEIMLSWVDTAGGNKSHGVAPDIRKPDRVVFPAPDGWQAVVVETGSSGDVSWIRVQDLIWTTVRNDQHRALQASSLAPARLKVGISLSHVGLSLVSAKRERELLYAEVRQVAALFGVWENSQCLELAVSSVQVDSQLLDGEGVPVILANRGERGLPCLRCKVVQQLPASRCAVNLHELAVELDALELGASEEFVTEVMQTVNDMLRPILSLEEVGLEQLEAWKTEPLGSEFEAPPSVPLQIAIDQFTFLGLEVHLWASMRLTMLPAGLRGALGFLTAGSGTLSIQGATLRLDPEVFDNIHGPAPTVAKIILYRYWANLLMSLTSLLGRSTLLELPGLPVKWGRRGMERGMRTINFLLKRTADVFEVCTLDQQYIRRKRRTMEQQAEEVTSLRSGISSAALHLAQGIWHFGDIVREPISGACETGLKGFVGGVGRGVIGMTVKPVLSVIYSVRALTRGVLSTVHKEGAGQRRVVLRRRPPRVMYGAGGIQHYDEAVALHALEELVAA